MFSIVNLIFITQSLSTLDSTFTSAAKLMGPEFTGACYVVAAQGCNPQRARVSDVALAAPCSRTSCNVIVAAAGLVEDGVPRPPNKATHR